MSQARTTQKSWEHKNGLFVCPTGLWQWKHFLEKRASENWADTPKMDYSIPTHVHTCQDIVFSANRKENEERKKECAIDWMWNAITKQDCACLSIAVFTKTANTVSSQKVILSIDHIPSSDFMSDTNLWLLLLLLKLSVWNTSEHEKIRIWMIWLCQCKEREYWNSVWEMCYSIFVLSL